MKKLTAKEMATRLSGREYGDEISDVEIGYAKDAGLVVVFGYSDDNVEFRGMITDERGCCEGAIFKLDECGLIPDREQIDDGNDHEIASYVNRNSKAKKTITALWCEEGDYSWTYKTEIPHETFEIAEDGGPYCRGIVFEFADLK